MSHQHAKAHQFQVANEVLETVTEYVYLGQVIAADPNHEWEITRR